MADSGIKDILILGGVAVGGYLLYNWWINSQAVGPATNTQLPTPGTTPTMNQAGGTTSVSTIQTSTPATGSPQQGTSASVPTVQQPTPADLQNALGHPGTANADQWNFVYRSIMGAGIDQVFNFNFDGVYGAVTSNGTRSSGQMTAIAFLNAPASHGLTVPQVPVGSAVSASSIQHRTAMSGLGNIANFYSPVLNSFGSMVYRSQHPSPYRFPQTSGTGFGAFTQPTGFENALWASGSLWRNRLF